MEIAEHMDALAAEIEPFVAAVEAAGVEAPVPTCPEWVVRDLVQHMGGVHRWAALHVREARTELTDVPLAELVGGWPDDDELVPWFREGHAQLVSALRAAPPDLAAVTFLRDVSSPLAFWARRQAHETTIHRIDAQAAAGQVTLPEPQLSSDGVDEQLMGIITRRSTGFRLDPARVIEVVATDTGATWSVLVGPDRITTERAPATDPGVTISGAAPDLYLYLWNRGRAEHLTRTGDQSLLDAWADQVKLRWS